MRALVGVLVPAWLLCACTPSVPHVSTTTTGWIHSDGSALRDEYGRQWIFRGINARVGGLFDVTFSDGRTALEPIPDFTEEHKWVMEKNAAFWFPKELKDGK